MVAVLQSVTVFCLKPADIYSTKVQAKFLWAVFISCRKWASPPTLFVIACSMLQEVDVKQEQWESVINPFWAALGRLYAVAFILGCHSDVAYSYSYLNYSQDWVWRLSLPPPQELFTSSRWDFEVCVLHAQGRLTYFFSFAFVFHSSPVEVHIRFVCTKVLSSFLDACHLLLLRQEHFLKGTVCWNFVELCHQLL